MDDEEKTKRFKELSDELFRIGDMLIYWIKDPLARDAPAVMKEIRERQKKYQREMEEIHEYFDSLPPPKPMSEEERKANAEQTLEFLDSSDEYTDEEKAEIRVLLELMREGKSMDEIEDIIEDEITQRLKLEKK